MDLIKRIDTALAGEPTPADCEGIIAEMLPQIANRVPYMLQTEGGQNTLRSLLAQRLPRLPSPPEAAAVGCSTPAAIADWLMVGATCTFVPVKLALGTARSLLAQEG